MFSNVGDAISVLYNVIYMELLSISIVTSINRFPPLSRSIMYVFMFESMDIAIRSMLLLSLNY